MVEMREKKLGEIPPPRQAPRHSSFVRPPTNDAVHESRHRFAGHQVGAIVRRKVAREHDSWE